LPKTALVAVAVMVMTVAPDSVQVLVLTERLTGMGGDREKLSIAKA